METTAAKKSEECKVDYSGVWREYGIDPRTFIGIDPRTLPEPQVFKGGGLMVAKFEGEKAELWLLKKANGPYTVTIKYKKSGRYLRADLDAVDQPDWLADSWANMSGRLRSWRGLRP